MKHKIILSATILTALIWVLGCKKNSFKVTERTNSEGSAQVKLGYFSAYSVLPNTILYINDKPVSNTLVAPIGFPGGGFNTGGSSNGDYLWVTPGSNKIQGFTPIPGTGNLMTKLFEFTQTFDANSSYTFYITDTAANTKGFSVPDSKTAPDSGFCRIKFVNCMPNLAALDLYKGANNTVATLFAGNVAYQSYTTNFDVALPTDSFFIRPAGALITTAPIARRAFAANLTNKRIYTLLARGYNGSTATNLAPNLSVLVNQ
ncbi:MAG: DUF4397 domain-containing protein [Chitinophagaceae bacterium]|nr:DUF4397 domain-containing protein [Chitinophagaceae bacterium]